LKSTGGADWNLEMDDDIDVYDINDVLWTMCSQADPVDATEIIRRC
jgi:UbiD family decarboxylase